MEQRGTRGMWGRYALFVILSCAVLVVNVYLMSVINPPKPPDKRRPVAAAPENDPREGVAGAREEEGTAGPREERPEPIPSAEAQEGDQPDEPQLDQPPVAVEKPGIPPDWVTLGSADPADPYRMLVTLTNQGASVVRIELSSRRSRDLEDRSGYLGHVVGDVTAAADGCPVQVVGAGTPAALAGLSKGDLIKAVDGVGVNGYQSLKRELKKSKPKQTVRLTVARQGRKDQIEEIPVTLRRRPLEVVRPEGTDPLSFLLTLDRIDEVALEEVVKQYREEIGDSKKGAEKNAVQERDESLGLEIDGLDLRTGTWEIEEHSQEHVVFRRALPAWGLEVRKTFRLAEVPAEAKEDETFKAYHLTFDVEIRNTGQEVRRVAYQLDGPTGLPIEGYWYAYKIGRKMGQVGLRDVAVQFEGANEPKIIPCPRIADGKVDPPWPDEPGESLKFIGVDAQYFSAVMIPQKQDPEEPWFAASQPLRVGPVDARWKKKTNTSCRVTSLAHDLEPGEALSHRYLIFAGPKKPDLLASYELKELVYYGWFGWVAKPMLSCLHVFYAVVGNYGLAIIMLTVLVRGAMFPLSKKQALGAQKMAELQPEIKKIHEKYKKDMEARTKAQQELFKKHNYNPLSGCLVLFLQLPIFIGLYRGLMVDVELRQAPLMSESIRWCSNLAAPDMLFDWSGFMPEFITRAQGFFGLGPYFNLLPVITIALFILQQKMFMPPPADEQAAMQQNVMKFMMVFMGIIFFKVASGLCLYFIASSLWGVAERKILPKHSAAGSGDKGRAARPQPSRPTPATMAGRNGGTAKKRRAEGDGAPAKKKRKKSRGKR